MVSAAGSPLAARTASRSEMTPSGPGSASSAPIVVAVLSATSVNTVGVTEASVWVQAVAASGAAWATSPSRTSSAQSPPCAAAPVASALAATSTSSASRRPASSRWPAAEPARSQP